MKRMAQTAAAVLVVATLSQASSGAVMVSSVVNGSTAPTIDNSFGAFEFALNLGNGGATVRDGVSFSNVNVTGGTNVNFFTAGSVSVDGVTTTNWNQANLGGDSLFNTEAYSGTNAALSVDITGLDAGKTYQVQFLHGEPRNLTYNGGTITVEDSLTNTDTDSLTFGPGGSGNQFALVTVELSGSTSLSYSLPSAGRGPSVAGIVVHSITPPAPAPEPSSIVLAVMGLVGLAVRRRRRNPC